MQLLDAAIAFALTLAGLATIVSIIIEILHRVFSLRARGLKAMLEQHFEDVMVPVIQARVIQAIQGTDKQLAAELKRLRENLVEKMTANPLEILQDSSWLPKRTVKALARYNEVTALDFLKRLPETQVYKYINLSAEAAIDKRLEKFEAKYEEYEKAISNYFKRRAQLLSFAVGIALAITVNIHGIRLFERYLNGPELTAALIARTENIESAMASVQKRQIADPNTKRDNFSEMQTALNQYNELMGNFMGLGLPIGWKFYPNCQTHKHAATLKKYDPECQSVLSGLPKEAAEKKRSTFGEIFQTASKDFWGFLKWLFVVVITGTLIGLGGPFWFDVASKLGGIRGKLKGNGKTAASGQSSETNADHHAVIEKLAADAKGKTAGKKTSTRKKAKAGPKSEKPDA